MRTLTPTLLLQAFVQRFGLTVQIGNQINKFILAEDIDITGKVTDLSEIFAINNPKNHSFVNSFFIRIDNQKDNSTIRCALVFAIDETEYMAWLKGRVFIPARIFLSYSRQDYEKVEKVYSFLKTADHIPYMDTEDLIGGANWENEIFQTIESSDIFIFCISNNSIGRRGMIRLEMKRALEKLDGMLSDDIFIIPLRLEECLYPPEIKHLHTLDWFHVQGPNRLVDSIQIAMERRSKTK